MLDDRVRGTGADFLRVECMTRCMMPLRERHMGDITCVSAGNKHLSIPLSLWLSIYLHTHASLPSNVCVCPCTGPTEYHTRLIDSLCAYDTWHKEIDPVTWLREQRKGSGNILVSVWSFLHSRLLTCFLRTRFYSQRISCLLLAHVAATVLRFCMINNRWDMHEWHVCMYVCTCVCVCIYIYIYSYIYMCVCVCVCVSICEYNDQACSVWLAHVISPRQPCVLNVCWSLTKMSIDRTCCLCASYCNSHGIFFPHQTVFLPHSKRTAAKIENKK